MLKIVPKFKPSYVLWLLIPVLLWWALKDIRWGEVFGTLMKLSAWQLVVLALLNLVIIFFFSIGWWLILRALGYPVPLWRLASYRLAGYGVAYFTPGPQVGGEPLQAYLVQRNHAVPGLTSAAATALDRVLELLINFAFLAVGIILVGQWGVWPGASPLVALGVVLAALALIGWFLWLTWHGRLPLTRFLQRLPIRWHGYPSLVERVAESERQVTVFCRNNPRTLLAVILVASLNWLLILSEYWLGLYFLGLPLSLRQLITAVTINRLAFLVPLPAGLGALESGQVLAMTLLGLDPAIGISQTLIIRARDVITALVGLGLGWRAAHETNH